MSETLSFSGNTKVEIYEELLPQLQGLLAGEENLVANLANTSSALKSAFSVISWVGFYLFDGRELILGPFQGKPACVRIQPGRGVCGTSFKEGRTVIVPDVRDFPGHIVCDPDSLSEIVVPIQSKFGCAGVLDVDSNMINAFDEVDERYLREVTSLVAPYFKE